ncbi:MAG: universal stress protein [Proteobacteria bacterium]|jgi:nucleotide-binding universal stress UspA family protein|nr:universal stress protein [Pseudomonadota bacterium]
MFNKIYVPIDNSDISDKVLSEALDLAKDTGAKVRISHVVNLEQITFGIEMVGVAELKDTLLEIANKLMSHVKETIKTKSVDAEVVLLENYGSDLALMIIDDAKAWQADLFVLGSHHLGSFSHFITGGVAEDIAHDSDIPILLITKHKDT